MVFLDDSLWFPDCSKASKEGLLAIGGDLSVERLLLAYKSGIFPWFSENEPILWWSPNPRMVLFPKTFKPSKSLRKAIKKSEFTITFNHDFKNVIKNCATVKRDNQNGTWITSTMIEAYNKLHNLGHAKSVEVWDKDKLVGGLYGIDLPEQKVFCGESMFSKRSNASKIAFYYLIEKLKDEEYSLIDCQIYTPHLESLGALEISREDFLNLLKSK